MRVREKSYVGLSPPGWFKCVLEVPAAIIHLIGRSVVQSLRPGVHVPTRRSGFAFQRARVPFGRKFLSSRSDDNTVDLAQTFSHRTPANLASTVPSISRSISWRRHYFHRYRENSLFSAMTDSETIHPLSIHSLVKLKMAFLQLCLLILTDIPVAVGHVISVFCYWICLAQYFTLLKKKCDCLCFRQVKIIKKLFTGTFSRWRRQMLKGSRSVTAYVCLLRIRNFLYFRRIWYCYHLPPT